MNVGGNGIGLYVCKKICESLDGTIHVNSIPDVGTRFTFTMKVFTDVDESIVRHGEIGGTEPA